MICNSIFYTERKQKKEKVIEDLTSDLKLKEGIIQQLSIIQSIYDYCFLLIVIEKELLSLSAERQTELETLQEIIMSLTLRLKDRDKQIKELKQNLRGKR